MSVIDVATASGAGLPAAVFQMTTGETYPLGCTVADLLSSGESIASATCLIRDRQTGRVVSAALPTTCTVDSTTKTITQTVLGSALEGGHEYYLHFGFNGTSPKRPAPRLRIEVAK